MITGGPNPETAMQGAGSTMTRISAIERLSEPGVLPFEVWDLVVGQSLWAEQFYEPGFENLLVKGVELLRAGRGVTVSKGPVPSEVAGFEAVLLTGGRTKTLAGFQRHPPAKLFVGTHGAYEGVQGGLHWLKMRGLAGWVLDLGQSQLKLSAGDRCWLFQRDSTRLRAHGEVSSAEIPAQRRRLREFIALKLQFALSHARERPQAMLAGFPARLDADGTPLGGNYAGLRGYRELIPDALESAGLSEVPAFVVNDAELAAFGARADPRLAEFRKILVITLGFGIGAALVCRAS